MTVCFRPPHLFIKFLLNVRGTMLENFFRRHKVSWRVPPWSVFKASKVGAYLSGTLLPYYHRRKRIGTNTLAYFEVVSVTRKESV